MFYSAAVSCTISTCAPWRIAVSSGPFCNGFKMRPFRSNRITCVAAGEPLTMVALEQ